MPELSISKQDVIAGKVARIPVMISEMEGVSSCTIDVHFPPALGRVIGVESGLVSYQGEEVDVESNGGIETYSLDSWTKVVNSDLPWGARVVLYNETANGKGDGAICVILANISESMAGRTSTVYVSHALADPVNDGYSGTEGGITFTSRAPEEANISVLDAGVATPVATVAAAPRIVERDGDPLWAHLTKHKKRIRAVRLSQKAQDRLLKRLERKIDDIADAMAYAIAALPDDVDDD